MVVRDRNPVHSFHPVAAVAAKSAIFLGFHEFAFGFGDSKEDCTDVVVAAATDEFHNIYQSLVKEEQHLDSPFPGLPSDPFRTETEQEVAFVPFDHLVRGTVGNLGHCDNHPCTTGLHQIHQVQENVAWNTDEGLEEASCPPYL